MNRKWLLFLCIAFLVADLVYSFVQYESQPLDGDISVNILETPENEAMFNSPLGTTAIFNDSSYVNPNRFFCHWSFRAYMLNAPTAFQTVTDPVESVFLSTATAKLFFHLAIILLLTIAINGGFKIGSVYFWISAILIIPLIQTNGFRSYMGIIDPSITYSFFYALPTVLVLLYLLPLFLKFYHNRSLKFSIPLKILWLLLAIVVCLSGPLNPGILLVVSFLVFTALTIKNFKNQSLQSYFKKLSVSIKQIPSEYWWILLPAILLSFYSLFLGRYNSNSLLSEISLLDAYAKLPGGLAKLIFSKAGFPILIAFIVLNILIIRLRFKDSGGLKLLRFSRWILVFAVLYILLLPLGGYRHYRPDIVRYDTFIPVTIALFLLFGMTTMFVLKQINTYKYVGPVILFLSFFTLADNPTYYTNQCEKEALQYISESEQNPVPLGFNCSVVEWRKIYSARESAPNAELLLRWNITKEKKLYFNY